MIANMDATMHALARHFAVTGQKLLSVLDMATAMKRKGADAVTQQDVSQLVRQMTESMKDGARSGLAMTNVLKHLDEADLTPEQEFLRTDIVEIVLKSLGELKS